MVFPNLTFTVLSEFYSAGLVKKKIKKSWNFPIPLYFWTLYLLVALSRKIEIINTYSATQYFIFFHSEFYYLRSAFKEGLFKIFYTFLHFYGLV